MKIISFTMVNNESEIIESFIRYNYNFIDKMVIIDNGCTDSTMEIIRLLIKEGYDITIYDESLEAYNQFRLDNKYLQKIINEMQPDIIIPLDADEFLMGDQNPRQILENLSLNKIYYVNWQWYVITDQDNKNEVFVPRKMQYCLKKTAWNYSDGTPVTKTIIPAKLFKQDKLTLSMGHHTVFGNDKVQIENLTNLKIAHFRAISELQVLSKAYCYTMRDIATMENNAETAQRTNQIEMIEKNTNHWDAAVEVSYAGYPREIAYKPLNLEYCKKNSVEIKYSKMAKEDLVSRVMKTGQEMAIRAYNSERSKKEKAFLKPIILWLDGIKGEECIFPAPTNKSTILTSLFNIRAYITMEPKIRYLKTNYRLIITPETAKFIPHEYVVIPDTVDFQAVKNMLAEAGMAKDHILSLQEYKKKLGLLKQLWCYIALIPSLAGRVRAYVRRNGIQHTLSKIKERLGK